MATIRDRTFDPDGDLFLIVGLQDEGSPCHFQVSSKAMSLASRDWATMIKDNSELVNNLLQTLTLPHDDADALAVLLNIAHLRFDDVPFDLPLRTLTNVAILCDKYNVTHLARPYQNSWIKRHDANSDQPDPRRPALLLISWVFGCHVTFERLTRSEILEEMIYREPAVFEAYLKKRLADGRDFNWNCMPPAIFSMITSTQNEVIQKLFDLLSHTQPTLVGKSEVCVKGSSLMTSNYFHGRANMSKQCRGRQLSDWWNYQKYLKGMGIYFDPNACRVTTTNPHLTLNEVWHHLSCAADWIGTPYGHEKCSIGKKIWQEADEIVHSIPQMIRDKHKTHFHERKLGSEKAARQEATVVEGRQEEHISPVQPDMATGIEQDEMLMDDPVHEKSTATSHHDNSKQNQHDRNDAGEAQDKEMVDHNAGWDRANDPRHERTKENEQQEDMEDAKSDSTVVGVEGDDKESEFALVVNQAEAVTNGTVDTA